MKQFWIHCKLYFSNKHSKADANIILNENGNLILKNEEIAKTFNDYFGSIVENLNLHYWEDKNSVPSNSSNKINDIKNFESHPSIYNIKTKHRGISKFSFQPVTIEEVKNIVRTLKIIKLSVVKYRLRY